MDRCESPIVILISANAEWQTALGFFDHPVIANSPFGGYFKQAIANQQVIFVKSGWGKISAAASTQYAIQAFSPRLIANLGTCGGIAGKIATGEVVLAEETLVYDIYERMGDAEEALRHYSCKLDLSFLRDPLPQPVRMGKLISADQDIDPAMVPLLIEKYGAVACDWESGAIAWTASRNNVPCLILRAVSDLVSSTNGEIYADPGAFHIRAGKVMTQLLENLPGWIGCSVVE